MRDLNDIITKECFQLKIREQLQILARERGREVKVLRFSHRYERTIYWGIAVGGLLLIVVLN